MAFMSWYLQWIGIAPIRVPTPIATLDAWWVDRFHWKEVNSFHWKFEGIKFQWQFCTCWKLEIPLHSTYCMQLEWASKRVLLPYKCACVTV